MFCQALNRKRIMAKTHYELVIHKFTGGRFDDSGLDVDVLPDLVAYKTILVETAKELWRRKHPERQRLPNNFEDSLSLKFYKIQPGSAGVPLMREVEDTGELFPRLPDELDEAVEIVLDSIDAVSADRALPDALPKNIIPLFENYGKTLRLDEHIELKLAKRQAFTRYSSRERERLLQVVQGDYEDIVDLKGEIRAADLDGNNFTLKLADGTKVPGKFSPQQETVITDALREHANRWLHLKGSGEFLAGGALKRIVSVNDLEVQIAGDKPFDPSVRPIWEVIEEIGASVPANEWDKVPTDGAINLDHYLYGHAKKT
jgi:hypothetical protein